MMLRQVLESENVIGLAVGRRLMEKPARVGLDVANQAPEGVQTGRAPA